MTRAITDKKPQAAVERSLAARVTFVVVAIVVHNVFALESVAARARPAPPVPGEGISHFKGAKEGVEGVCRAWKQKVRSNTRDPLGGRIGVDLAN